MVAILEIFPGKDRVVVLQRTTGERQGRRLDIVVCQPMSLRGGKIADVRGFQGDQYALDAFWVQAASGFPCERERVPHQRWRVAGGRAF